MVQQHKEMLGIVSTIAIVLLSVYVVHRFIPSMMWAGIITMISFPIYERFERMWAGRKNIASFCFTAVVSIGIVLPMFWLLTVFISETQVFLNFIVKLHNEGGKLPEAIANLPSVGPSIEKYWLVHFSDPESIRTWLSGLHLSLMSASYYLKKIGASVVHRSFQLGFTMLCLFFFYRDGRVMATQIDKVGKRCLGQRWSHFTGDLPQLLRATVNGTVLVGIGVGIIMGICYNLLGFVAPAIAGFFTAIAAMIPFVVPVVFISVALGIWLNGAMLNAFILLVIGTVVMFIADHFVKPVLIGSTTRLHFLAVLFGLLGGVEAFGLMGLFLGPIVMVFFMTLWRELLE